jgi:DNA mismatch repair ATPase MutS
LNKIKAYFDQAIEVSELLNIKQAKYQFCGHAYPFSGFPIASLQKHLKTLVNEYNRVVAIAEQILDGEDLERRIVRIITPGTITDENLIDNESYNYLLGIHQNQLAWLDVSTGSYFHTTCEGGESGLMDEICRISPKEIIISADSSFRISPNSKAAKLSILITKIKNPGSVNTFRRAISIA